MNVRLLSIVIITYNDCKTHVPLMYVYLSTQSGESVNFIQARFRYTLKSMFIRRALTGPGDDISGQDNTTI